MMSREELEKKGYTVKDNGRIDFSKPPKGKMFVFVEASRDYIRDRQVPEDFITYHRFSATTKLVVVELVDDSAKTSVAVAEHLKIEKNECKKKERMKRCKVKNDKTGREISCPERFRCGTPNCPKEMGWKVRTLEEIMLSFEAISEYVKGSVECDDPTADEAIINVEWANFKNRMKREYPIYSVLISNAENGYEREAILKIIGKDPVKSSSWYYDQWVKIRKLWHDYYDGES